MGYTTYIKPVVPEPTIPEVIAGLTGAQKLLVLNGFADDVAPGALKHEVPIKVGAIREIYRALEGIRTDCNALMREEVLLQEEVRDPETDEVITPAVYNDQPADIDELKAIVSVDYEDVFTAAQVGAAIDKQISYAEEDKDGNKIGTWTVYAANVVL